MTMEGNSGAAEVREGLLGRLESSACAPRGRYLVLCLAVGSSLLLGLGSIGPWGAREKRLAACVADVVREGNWLVPRLWGRSRLEKPPLPYWFTAAGALLAGKLNEWTLRMPGVVAALLILATVYRIGSEAGGRHVGLLAALFLLSSIYFAVEVRSPSSDLFLTCLTTATLGCWWCGYRSVPRRAYWWAAAGLCCALAIGCKGPVAFAVLLPPILGLLAWQRELALPWSSSALLGVLLALSLGALWVVMILALEPQAWLTWVQQIDEKALGGGFPGFRGDYWYYLLQWPQYLFPWAVFSVVAVRYGFQRGERPVPLAVRFAWFWFFGNLALFSLFATKKIYYLMPAVPGLAILAAYAAGTMSQRISSQRGKALLEWSVHGQLALLSATQLVMAGIGCYLINRVGWTALGLALAMAAACAAVHLLYVRERKLTGACLASGLLFCVATGLCHSIVLPHLDELRSPKSFVARVVHEIPEHAPMYFWGEPDPSWWFYLDRPIRPVTVLRNEAAGPYAAYFLVAVSDLDREPAIARRLEILATTRARDPNLRTVLARIAQPLPELPIFSL